MSLKFGKYGKLILTVIFLFFAECFLFAEDMDIFSFARSIDAKVIFDQRSEIGRIVAPRYTYYFKVGIPWVVVDSGKKIGNCSIINNKGMFIVPEKLCREIKQAESINIVKNNDDNERIAVIFIDPGHGGKDPGAIGTYRKNGKNYKLYEKNVVLNVAVDLQKKLAAAYPDKKIMLTRSGDTFPTLDQRVVMANNFKLKNNETMLFVSVHANASMNTRARGFEVWYLPPEYKRLLVDSKSANGNKNLHSILNTMQEDMVNRDSIALSNSVLNRLDEQVGKDIPNRGIKAESWYVVRKAKMPSILIELGFVTNPDEALLLSTSSYLQKISLGIYNGIQDFVYSFEHSGSDRK